MGGIYNFWIGSLGSSILPLVGIGWVDFIYFKCKKLAGSVEGFPNVRLSSLARFNVLCLNSGMPPKHFAKPIGSMGIVRIIIYIYHKNQPSMSVNIPVPWIRNGNTRSQEMGILMTDLIHLLHPDCDSIASD